MSLVERAHIRLVAADWEKESDISTDIMSFAVGNSGQLTVVFTIPLHKDEDHLFTRMRALDIGAVATIQMQLQEGLFKTSFSDAVLVSKIGASIMDGSPSPVLTSVTNRDGYSGFIQLEFHVGPIVKRQ